MSRNFELLRNSGGDRSIFAPATQKAGASSNGHSGPAHAHMLVHDEEMKMVQRLFLLTDPGIFRAVVFCGAEQDDGAGSICARVAKLLAAQVTGSVCVVDADTRSPQLHTFFGVSNQRGWCEALRDGGPIRDYAQRLALANLWLLSSRRISERSSSWVTQDRLRRRMEDLRSSFDYILIHSPAATVSADAVSFGQLADGAVLIIRANSTHRETARKAKETLQFANVTLLGAVLNKRQFPIPETLYRAL